MTMLGELLNLPYEALAHPLVYWPVWVALVGAWLLHERRWLRWVGLLMALLVVPQLVEAAHWLTQPYGGLYWTERVVRFLAFERTDVRLPTLMLLTLWSFSMVRHGREEWAYAQSLPVRLRERFGV